MHGAHTLLHPQALWAVLDSYQSAQEAIAAAVAEPAPLKAAAAAARKQTPGTKEALDPDEWLPVRQGGGQCGCCNRGCAASGVVARNPLEPAADTCLSASHDPPPGQGPSKFLLEATLRALSSVLAAADAAASAAAPAAPAAEGGVRSWLSQQPPAALVCLLLHASGRVQVSSAHRGAGQWGL
jgi:hypothetical protein